MNVILVSNIECIRVWAAVMSAAANPFACDQCPDECDTTHEFARERANVEMCEYCHNYYFN